jgi:hypothetical protein
MSQLEKVKEAIAAYKSAETADKKQLARLNLFALFPGQQHIRKMSICAYAEEWLSEQAAKNSILSYREVLGERLKDFRESRGITLYRVAKDGGITINSAKAVEAGETAYTIDTFLGYIAGSRLYMYFADKENQGEFTDFEELVRKAEL